MILLAYLLLFLPLAGFVLLIFGRSILPKPWGGWLAAFAVLGSFLSAAGLLSQQVFFTAPILTWFQSGFVSASLSLLIDPLSLWMTLMITGVGFLILVYSIGYMKEEPRFNSFFAYLNLFVFFMLILVLSDSYVGMFAGWEGVGLCSYLLIGFWYETAAYAQAAKKAFMMNRVGDLGFLMGILILFSQLGTAQFGPVFAQIPLMSPEIVAVIAICLLIGAVGKSAQIPLYTWLPDAMAGPTPVSALIHAATMVTAGIYLIARSQVIYTMAPMVSTVVMVIGLATAVLGGVFALAQRDIKKILAYSTMSQLGFMMAALGVGAYTSALFHMTTHAFFKALLFLAAGNVIHALDGEQDIFKMGGLRKQLPFTFIVFLVGALSIVACPPFSGYFSKDGILLAAYGYSKIAFGILSGVSVLTIFYTFRMVFLVFFGKARHHHHPHEGTWVMQVPLAVLAVLAAVGGVLNLPEHPRMAVFLNTVCANVHFSIPEGLETVLLWAILGLLALKTTTAFLLYARKNHSSAQPDMNFFHRFLYHKFYIDEVYEWVLIAPYRYLCQLLSAHMERGLSLAHKALGKGVQSSTRWLKYSQTGQVGLYVLMMVVGVLILLLQWVSL